jgi:hypothetical protein
MTLTALIIGAIAVAALFLGLPYYQAYRRRKELEYRERMERERQKSGREPGSDSEGSKE